MPCCCAPTMSPSRSSPTIHVELRVGVERLERGREVRGARLAEHRRLDVGGVLEPGDERARVEPRRRRPSATSGSCAGSRARRRPRARGTRGSGSGTRRRGPVSSPSSAPPISTASTFMPTSCRPVEVVEDARASSARARACPSSARAATPPVVCSSSSSSSMPIARSCSASCARERVVEFVTKRSRCPASRRRAHRGGRSGDRRAGNVQHAVHVQENRRHGRRVYSVGRSPSGSPARAGRAASTRRRARRASRRSSTSRRRPALTRRGAARACSTKLGPVVRAVAQDERSQLRNRELATDRIVEQLREATKVAARAAADEADDGVRRSGGSTRRSAAVRRSASGARPTTDLTALELAAGTVEARVDAVAERRARARPRTARMMAIAVMAPQCLSRDYQHKWMILLISIMEPDSWLGVELRHFAALQALADEGSFGRAAKRLGYTQSAISQQIATLERIVGERLVERPGGPRPISLTEAGQLLLRHAESIVARLQAAQADLQALRAGEVGTLRVGTFQSAGARLLPEIMRRFTDAVARDRRDARRARGRRDRHRGRARRARRRLRRCCRSATPRSRRSSCSATRTCSIVAGGLAARRRPDADAAPRSSSEPLVGFRERAADRADRGGVPRRRARAALGVPLERQPAPCRASSPPASASRSCRG